MSPFQLPQKVREFHFCGFKQAQSGFLRLVKGLQKVKQRYVEFVYIFERYDWNSLLLKFLLELKK